MSGLAELFSWDSPVVCAVREISEGGLLLSGMARVSEGGHATLRITLPGEGRAFTILGRIVRVQGATLLREATLAIAFVDISAAQRERIRRFVEQRVPRAA